jgi:hypothetical protein
LFASEPKDGMPLFRKRTQADELARRRSPSLGRKELTEAVRGVVEEAGLPVRKLKDAWMVELDSDVQIALRPFADEGVVAGVMLVGKTHGVEHMLELLQVNLQHRLSYFTGSIGPPELDARIRIPVDPFDREGLLLGLQSLAELLDALVDENMSGLVARIRNARRPQPSPHDAARAAMRTSLDELELAGGPGDDEDIWRIETDGGALDAILHESGETWMLMHPLGIPWRQDDERMVRWMLDASGSRGARLGLADQPDGLRLYTALVLPTSGLNVSSLAYGVEQVVRLRDEVDAQIPR